MKINSVYAGGGADGMERLASRLHSLLGFPVDGYVLVDLEAFKKTVDLVGGVDFDVPQDMNYEDASQDLYIHLKKGLQHLDGEKAMEPCPLPQGLRHAGYPAHAGTAAVFEGAGKAVPVRQQPDKNRGVCRHFCRICHHEPHNRQYGLVRQGAAGLRF